MKIARVAPGYYDSLFSSVTRRSTTGSANKPNLLTASHGKVAVDLVISIILLVALAPVMIGIAIAVMLDGGPVLYRHMRIGKDGQRFNCLKFRSMGMGGDTVLAARLAEDSSARDEWMQTQKLKDDPRVTRVGKVLRATSLDELPQLFNVMKLDMSLVGPRPIVEDELQRYGKHVNYYLKVRPGVTGLWQVSGRSNTSYARRVALDAWYVKTWRLWRDVAILFRTISVVARRDGAH